MAEAFKNWKKKLYLNFVKLDKTPDFNHGGYAKLRHQWADFVKYKTSEKALERSRINKENTAKKVYHHNMRSAGYTAGHGKPGPTRPENGPARRAKACCRAGPGQDFLARQE
jgi:hypothetical protein